MNSTQVLQTLEGMAEKSLLAIEDMGVGFADVDVKELYQRVLNQSTEYSGSVLSGMLQMVIKQLQEEAVHTKLSNQEVVKNYISSSKTAMTELQTAQVSDERYDMLANMGDIYMSTCKALGYSLDAPVGTVLNTASSQMKSFQDQNAVRMFVKLGLLVYRVSKEHNTKDETEVRKYLEPHLRTLIL